MNFKPALSMMLLAVSLLCGSGISTASESVTLVFIVNADNPVGAISEGDLREMFFKRKKSWPDGTAVRFIDRSSGSAIRQDFLKSILMKKSDEIEMYWIGQKLYSGDSAPLQQASDAMTIRFVESFKGAIGYVSSSTELSDRKVKAVKVER
ncbi:MAG: substrate-binding domain-containing protein [Bdellovibrionota bacterium]